MARRKRTLILGVAEIAAQNAEDLDERFDMPALDAGALFVALWQLMVEQDLPTKLQRAVDLVEAAFNIS
jgi:hypothetical protein